MIRNSHAGNNSQAGNNGQAGIKQGKASLIGGIAVGVASFVLWTAIAHELAADNIPTIIAGVLVAAGIATWIRVADL